MTDVEQINQSCAGKFPDLLGIKTVSISAQEVSAEMPVTESHFAPNGYLHAGAIVALADTTCGNGCLANLPEGALGFTTVELKSNHLGTAREGKLLCRAKPVHLGRTTQVWDATVLSEASGKTVAVFRCTQMILYPKI